MGKIIKKIIYSILLLLVLISAVVIYTFRERDIDFNLLLPQKIEYCGKAITKNDSEYIELSDWLDKNKEGWSPSIVTYVQNYVFYSPEFQINVLQSNVIITFVVADKGFQFVHEHPVDWKFVRKCNK